MNHPKISFPKEEETSIKQRLADTGFIYTTRIQKEFGKYKLGKTYETPWGDCLTVVEIKKYEADKAHPFELELTAAQKELIFGQPFEVIKLKSEICLNIRRKNNKFPDDAAKT